MWCSWSNHEIFVLLVKRIETFFRHSVDETQLLKMRQRELARFLGPIMEPRFTGSGKWENAPMYRVLMSLIQKTTTRSREALYTRCSQRGGA